MVKCVHMHVCVCLCVFELVRCNAAAKQSDAELVFPTMEWEYG